MNNRLPYIDQIYWEEVNNYLSQMIAPHTGGIHFWNSNNPKPINLGLANEGITGWDTSSTTLQRWTGSAWIELTYGTEILRPLVTTLLNDNGNNLQPQWLKDLIINSFINWNPTTLPPWIINIFNIYIDNLPLSVLLPLLNTWSPASNSPVGTQITQAGLSGGITPEQFIALFTNWSNPVPTWIVNYINALLANKSWSNTSGEASYSQLITPLTEWFNSWLKNDITSKFNFGSLGGVFTFAQIQDALGFWFTSSLKAYIDSGDVVNKQYMDNIFNSLGSTVTNNYNDILNRINTHQH